MAERATIKVCDVLNQANKGHPITDADITGDCQTCRRAVPLSRCDIKQGAETTYSCDTCGGTVVIIGAPDGIPWPGRGYRLGDFLIRNASSLRSRGLLIPKSPNALATSREQAS
jgi:hypothetical protein